MRITELIIDGFKSYAVRTVITGWDPTFNAITGLNGSGKSNILDAICFALYGSAPRYEDGEKRLRSDHAEPEEHKEMFDLQAKLLEQWRTDKRARQA